MRSAHAPHIGANGGGRRLVDGRVRHPHMRPGGCLRVSRRRRVSGDSPQMLRAWVWAARRPATGATGVNRLLVWQHFGRRDRSCARRVTSYAAVHSLSKAVSMNGVYTSAASRRLTRTELGGVWPLTHPNRRITLASCPRRMPHATCWG
eukprot:6197144-Pleurochrysis_carterae.AAC.1